MFSKQDVYLTAEYMIEHYGQNAEQQARLVMEKLVKLKKQPLATEWLRIAQCIHDMTADKKETGG